MVSIIETDIFKNWIRNLKDRTARSIINARIRRVSLGNKGDTKYIGDGVSELRIDYGPGYRVYYYSVNQEIIILLCGGDKSTQHNDIENAKQIAFDLEEKDEKN
jgi:putative addiction module killer protein